MTDRTLAAVPDPPPTPTQVLYAGKRDPAQVLLDWQTVRIRSALGAQYRQSSRIMLRRPWWMPGRLYHRLMRSIVIEAQPVETRQKGRP